MSSMPFLQLGVFGYPQADSFSKTPPKALEAPPSMAEEKR